MKKAVSRISAFVIAGLISLTSMPVFAASTVRTKDINLSPIVDDSRTGSVAVSYTDDTDGKAPVVGAKFTLYKIGKLVQSATSAEGGVTDNTSSAAVTPDANTLSIASGAESSASSTDSSDELVIRSDADKTASSPESVSSENDESAAEDESVQKAMIASDFESIVDGVDITEDIDPVKIQDAVQKAYKKKVTDGKTYTMTTDKNGEASIKKVELGLYLAVETKPAKEHFASIPFLVSVPQMIYSNKGVKQGWNYDVKVYPKALPAGDLIIEKQLAGTAPDKNADWHFKVTFDTKTAKSASDDYTKKIVFGEAPNGYHTAYGENQVTSDDESTTESIVSRTISGESMPDSTAAASSNTESASASDTSSDDVSEASSDAESDANYGRGYERASRSYNFTTSDGRKGTIKSGDTITLKGGQTATQKTAQKVTFVNKRNVGRRTVVNIVKRSGGNGYNGGNGGQQLRRTGVKTGDIMWRVAVGALIVFAGAMVALVVVKKKGKGGNKS